MFYRFEKVAACALVSLALAGCASPMGVVDDVRELSSGMPSSAEAMVNKTASLTPAVSADALVEEGYLTVGLATGTATVPNCYMNGSLVAGIDVDAASALADELGLKVRFVTASAATGSLGTSCDVVMGATATNSSTMTVVGDYSEEAIAFFHRGEDTVVSSTDLAGKMVGLQAGSISQTAYRSTGLAMAETEFANLNEAFDALSAGSIDYVLCSAYQGAYLAAGYDDISFAGAIGTPKAQGVAVLISNTELVAAIENATASVFSNGELGIIRGKWIGGMPSVTSERVIADVTVSTAPTSVDAPSAGANAASV